ncbi:MAG: T9SS type A sorting domain-containing protein [Bacteroidota bacterium]
MKNNSRIFIWIVLILMYCFSNQQSAFSQSGATFKQWGDETLSQISNDYYIIGSALYAEDLTHVPAYAWSQGIQFHALVAAGRISEAEALANEFHSRYWCYFNNRWGYNSSVDNCGDRYYDDNAWIAKALMELYKVTTDTTYLNRAKDVIAFSMSGENPIGGIHFHEGDTSGWSVCATAPTSVVNLMIYQATGIQQYLIDGKRLYQWMKSQGWGIGPGYRGYENALETQAAVLLFKLTGDSTYLSDAQHLGLAMETFYINWSTHALNETGQWGGHDMTNAYVDLYNLDGDINWLNIPVGYLKYLHDKCKDAGGRYPENWNDTTSGGNAYLLYQASAARAYERIGNSQGGDVKFPDPIALFQDCNYGGYSAGFGIGKYTMSNIKFHGVHDNDVSSVKVQAGYKITFYKDDNFMGDSLIKTADESCLVGDSFNDVVSSFKIECISPTVVVYNDCNFAGTAYIGTGVNLSVGDYLLSSIQSRGLKDKNISSIKVATGYQIRIFENDSFGGSSILLTTEDSCLSDIGWDNRISSMKIEVLGAGIKNNYNASFSYSPNPVTDNLKIELNSNLFQTVMVYDVNGKLLISNNINSQKVLNIDFHNLEQGVYIVQLNGNSKTEVFKVAKR